jgi:hypothetical protein
MRLILWLFVAAIAAGAVWGLFYGSPLNPELILSFSERLAVSAVLLLIGAFCAWVGIFGQGNQRNSLKDDVALHRENQKRYGWRR